MGEIIERVADELRKALRDHDCRRLTGQAYYEAVARIAIATMREPTDAMLDKGEYANSEWLNDNAPIGQRMYRAPAKSVWQSMIDASVL